MSVKTEKLVIMHLIVDEIVLNRILVHAKDVNYFKEYGYSIVKNGDPEIGTSYKGK